MCLSLDVRISTEGFVFATEICFSLPSPSSNLQIKIEMGAAALVAMAAYITFSRV